MEVKLLSIRAKDNVFLSLDGKPINPNKPVWNSEGVQNPAAFLLKENKPAQLEVVLGVPAAKPGEDYQLEGLFNRMDLFSGTAKAGGKEIVFTVSARVTPQGFFKIQGRDLRWKLTKTGTGESAETQGIPIELYWVFGADYRLFKRGVPVEHLRELAAACPSASQLKPDQLDKGKKHLIDFIRDKAGLPAAGWSVKEVVEWCFKRNPPSYDIYRGAPHFVQIESWDNITLLLKKYLAAINNPKALCNCYDMAAVVQYYFKVIGVSETKYCYMNPFGYLKKTDLIGRGICNNPFYGVKEAPPVVSETDPSRTAFANHAFCNIPADNWITDACAGPHTGGESPEQYVAAAVDTVYPNPPKVPQGTVNDIGYYIGVTNVSFVSSLGKSSKFPQTVPFDRILGTSGKEPAHGPEEGVVCRWPDPRECPELKKDQWELFHQDTVPGPEEVMKTWSLKKGEESVEINVYVSSKGNHLALNRFRGLGSLSSLPELPYVKGRQDLGEYSAQSEVAGKNRYFWAFRNVVFDVHCSDVTFNIEKLLDWLKNLAAANTKKDIAPDLPPVDGISCPKTDPKPGEDITMTLKAPSGIKGDFGIRGDGLRLTDETPDSLLFTATGKSENVLTVFNVNPETLLTNSKEIRITVR